MELKRKFIGVSISKLFASPPESKVIDLRAEILTRVFDQSLSTTERVKLVKTTSWWYSKYPRGTQIDRSGRSIDNLGNLIDVPLKTAFYDQNGYYDSYRNLIKPVNQNAIPVRTCLRLKFDLQKLYDYKITTAMIAEFISKYKYEFTIPKKVNSQTTKRETEQHKVLAIPSPTCLGIVDVFLLKNTDDYDHLLISLIHTNEFSNMIISGIKGISNFYAVSTSVTRLLRDVSETSRFEEQKGMWLHLESNRFLGIPYSRVLLLLDKAGINYELPCFNNSKAYQNMNTDLPFEYISHKSVPELRNQIIIKARLSNYDPNDFHFYPAYMNLNRTYTFPEIHHYSFSPIEKASGVDVYLLPNGESVYDQVYPDSIVCPHIAGFKDEIVSYIKSLNYHLN